MSFTVSIHPGDKLSVGTVTDDKCFYVNLPGDNTLMIWDGQIRWFRDQLLERYPLQDDPKICELCDEPATTTETDELGNECLVCADHAEALAAKKPERQADEYYDQTHKSGDE